MLQEVRRMNAGMEDEGARGSGRLARQGRIECAPPQGGPIIKDTPLAWPRRGSTTDQHFLSQQLTNKQSSSCDDRSGRADGHVDQIEGNALQFDRLWILPEWFTARAAPAPGFPRMW